MFVHHQRPNVRKYHECYFDPVKRTNRPEVSPPPERYEAYTPYSPASPEKPGRIPSSLDVNAASKLPFSNAHKAS